MKNKNVTTGQRWLDGDPRSRSRVIIVDAVDEITGTFAAHEQSDSERRPLTFAIGPFLRRAGTNRGFRLIDPGPRR